MLVGRDSHSQQEAFSLQGKNVIHRCLQILSQILLALIEALKIQFNRLVNH